MAGGRGDVNSQTPSGLASEDGFGGISTTDVRPVWETEKLPDWVVYWLIPMLSSGQSWPKASESGLWRLREAHRQAMHLYGGAFEPTTTALRTISAEWDSPAKPTAFTRIGRLYDENTGAMSKMAGHYRYARQVDAFALETQYSKISINVAFWVAVIAIAIALYAAFFSAGASTAAVGPAAAGLRATIARILARLGLVAARPAGVAAATKVTTLAGSMAGSRLASAAVIHELVEEIGEEVFIDAYSQYKQIQMGTRSSWDWKKTMAAAIGAGVGAVAGTKLATPVSRVTNAIPGIGRLNRTAGDLPGWGNAFKRFPGRVLNTGLNNVVASPAGSFVANGLVYGQWTPPTADSLLGGFMGGAGRTNTISPFNPSVAGALVNPAGALDSAMTAAATTDLARAETQPDAGLRSSLNGTGPSGGPQAPGTANPANPANPSVVPMQAGPVGQHGGGGATAASGPSPDLSRAGDPSSSRTAASPAHDAGQSRAAGPQADAGQRGDSRDNRSGQPAQDTGEPAGEDRQEAASQPAPAEEPAPGGPRSRSIDDLINAAPPDAAPAANPSVPSDAAPAANPSTPSDAAPAATPSAPVESPAATASGAPADVPAGDRTTSNADAGTTALVNTAAQLDHATRTPQLNVDPPPGAPQQHAHAYDPRAVPLAPQWEGLRRSAAATPVTVPNLPTAGAIPVEVRRILVPWRGTTRPVTEFTVQVYYRAAPGMTAEEIAAAHAALLKGVDLYYNYQHQLPDGSQLHVRMEFTPAPDSTPDERVVLLHRGTGTRAADFADRESWHAAGEVITTPLDQMAAYHDRAPIHYMSWYAGMEPVVFAHETMHLFGMLDEYVNPRDSARRHIADSGVHVDANLLGQATLFWAQGRPMLDREGRTVADAAALRDRHLRHLYDLIPEGAPSPRVPLVRAVPQPNAEQWSRPDYDPARHLPGDVRSLLDRFPANSRPMGEHVRLLERMNILFGDGQRLTDHHLAYTDALVAMARHLYGTGPDYSFSGQELTQLRQLTDLLLGDALPQADRLQGRINALLDRDPATPVTRNQVQMLASIAATVSPSPGESRPEALRRGLREQVRTMQGLIRLRQAGIKTPPATAAPMTDAGTGLHSSLSAPPPDPSGAQAPIQDGNPRQFLRFWRHLMSQVRTEAARRGTAPLDELQQVAIQRALARVFAANPDDWMLKGGQGMLARNPDGRASTDLDFVRMSGNADPDAMADEYEAALLRDHGDHFRFVRESKTYILHGKAVRMSHKVYCGDMEIMSLGVDLAPPRTRPVWKEPDIIPFPRQILATGHPDESPNLRVISFDDTLAHKVSGMYTHGIRTLETRCNDCRARGKGLFSCRNGDLPYRTQDLVDVIMIILNSSWDGPATHDMLHKEFAWRLEQGENLKVPPAFEVPNPDWFRKFDGYARTTPGLPYGGLVDAIPVVQAFLDPLLSEEPPPPSRWDPEHRRWVPEGAPEPVANEDVHVPQGTPDVRRLEVPRNVPASELHADPEMVARWDRLSAGELDAELRRLKADPDLSPAQKLDHVVSRMMYDNGYVELTRIPGPDNAHYKHLRFYAHQRGELYSHAVALMTDPELTIEIAYEPDRGVTTYQWDAHQRHIAYLGPEQSGIPAHQANAAAMRRMIRQGSLEGIDPTTLIDDLVELQAQPLRDALGLRKRLIEDYGIEPDRIRLAFANTSQKSHYSETQWMRAQLFALQAIQADPEQARQRMVDRMLGPDEQTAARRRSRAQAVVDRLLAANGQADEYALLWVRDTRGQPVGGRHGPHLDTRPEILRQTIEALRAEQPGRRIVLLGDDVFAGRPGLEEAWRREGVLDGVDTRTLVHFWDDPRNGGRLDYAEQGLFYHLLNTQHDVVQLGMESGAMEIPAMLGLPTVYFEAREHDGNKGNRWMLYWQNWSYGRFEQLADAAGNPRFDGMGRPVMTFQVDDTSPAPLPAMRRLLFGPDLPDPDNRRGQPVAVYQPARVAVTMDRVNRLVSSGEMDQWPRRLGRSVTIDGASWTPWSDADWKRSAYYADQLRRWLRADARTPEEIGRKWHGIRLALLGVLQPGFTSDEEYEGVSVAHPYTVLHVERNRIDKDGIKIARAYATDLSERAAAVTEVLKSLLASPEFTQQAIDDLRVFQLDAAEVSELRAAVRQVTAPRARPYADRLDTPFGPGQPTPREVLERFDPAGAGLAPVTAEEAAAYIARNAAERPWLAAAAGLDPAVQRVLVAVDQGQGHHLARHGAYAADGRLEGRVARLEDPAQTDPVLRARAADAFKPDNVHRAPDTATAINDPVAFAVAVARAAEHPDVRAALASPFDPDRRPARVSLPISDLLGPDGHLYCSGYRIVPVDGTAEAAVANRWEWVLARRDGRTHDGPVPRAMPMESFEGGTVELFFLATRDRSGYEIGTMFVDPPPRTGG